jgi:hypothetical protein
MDKEKLTQALKRKLLSEVALLYERDRRRWKAPIVETVRELKQTGVAAVFFGGTLRSLLLSRILRKKPGRPRDIDIVVAGASVEMIKERFQTLIKRETRFGGVRMERMNWQFDLWPLDRTWAFVHDNVAAPAFAFLPQTTFFNLEAIAVDVWPHLGRTRKIYSGDDQFFEGVITRTLELNRAENPFPGLCVVRSLVMAASLECSIGPRLAGYLAANAGIMHRREFEAIQKEHYGRIRYDADTMRSWLDHVVGHHTRHPRTRLKLPLVKQKLLWPEARKQASLRFNLRILDGKNGSCRKQR